MFAAATDADYVSNIELDMRFHTLIINAARNKVLSRNWKLSGASGLSGIAYIRTLRKKSPNMPAASGPPERSPKA
jgi:DNA-binding GntR family transcriptional regulator